MLLGLEHMCDSRHPFRSSSVGITLSDVLQCGSPLPEQSLVTAPQATVENRTAAAHTQPGHRHASPMASAPFTLFRALAVTAINTLVLSSSGLLGSPFSWTTVSFLTDFYSDFCFFLFKEFIYLFVREKEPETTSRRSQREKQAPH